MLRLLLAWVALGPTLGQGPGPTEEAAASCGPTSCYVVFYRRRTFLEAWRACRELGGNLATPKTPEEAQRVGLLAGRKAEEIPGQLLWIGLQRQPRQCHPQRPLRGFTWTTGDQDTAFTNWASPAGPGSCPALRCVAMEAGGSQLWREGSCTLPVDGYLCQFGFKAACPALAIEEGQDGPTLYTTPFQLVTDALAWLPFGSVADVPCLEGGSTSLLCMQRPEGGVGWSRRGLVCPGLRPGMASCALDNGGCEHECVDEAGGQVSCRCAEGFRLDGDGHSCVDPCAEAPCEQQCEPGGPGGYSCHCRLGFRPADDEPHRCLDTDECQIPGVCQQMCVNYVGGFECYCSEGHELEPDGISCSPQGAGQGALGGETQEEDDEEDDEEEEEDDDEDEAWDSFDGGWTESLGPLWLDPTRPPLAFDPPYRPLLPHVSPTRPPVFIAPRSPYRPPLLSITRPPRLPSTHHPLPPAHWLPMIPATPPPLPPAYQLPVFSATHPPAQELPAILVSPPPLPPVHKPLGGSTTHLPTPPAHQLPAHSATKTPLLPTQHSPILPTNPPPLPPARRHPVAPGAHRPAPSVQQPPLVSATKPPPPSASQLTLITASHRPLHPAHSSPATQSSFQPSLPLPLSTDQAPQPPTSQSLRPQTSHPPAPYSLTPSEALSKLPASPTPSPLPGTPSHPPAPPDPGPALDVLGSSLPSPTAWSRSRRDDRWLLVALLVPTCVFLVILLAVGIVYCTRSGPRAPNKSITDCYHWITNSGAKGETEPKGASLSGVMTCRTSV
uniref:LOW QUALITY PROTEIN: endosialin n=1 Tax=Phascolarctos cinereus TaxID=38626 RepID=A0A6P5IYH1_PHACI|nr:LOW QUALITY PROTEIN: endosialin [Phascolarctos cinereus]